VTEVSAETNSWCPFVGLAVIRFETATNKGK